MNPCPEWFHRFHWCIRIQTDLGSLILITPKERTLNVWKNNGYNSHEQLNFDNSTNSYFETSRTLWPARLYTRLWRLRKEILLGTRSCLSFQGRVSKAACNLFTSICHYLQGLPGLKWFLYCRLILVRGFSHAKHTCVSKEKYPLRLSAFDLLITASCCVTSVVAPKV